MACFNPIPATQLLTGGIIVHKRLEAITRKPTSPTVGKDIKIPCGGCIGCRMQRTQDWATRCLHESQLHSANCALTLTYDSETNYRLRPDLSTSRHVDNREDARELSTSAPEGLKAPNIARVGNSRSGVRGGEDLSIEDHQKFMKKLREKIGIPVRYYMCGEYGANLKHPHYHYLLFGYDFPDKKYFKTSLAGTKLYRSAELEKIWTAGFSWIGEVDYKTCAYVASYVMKKMNGEKAQEHYRRTDEAGNDYWLTPEFNLMSRGGKNGRGIASEWWEKFHKDVTVTDGVWRHGSKTKPPRYYDKLLKEMNPRRYEEIKNEREANAQLHLADNTPERLQDKEVVAKARVKLKKRQMENDK